MIDAMSQVSIGQVQAPPEYLSAELFYDPDEGALAIRGIAQQAIKIVELQGSKEFLMSFEAVRPGDFTERQFGDGVEIPPEMRDDIAAINATNFRWGCDIAVAAGQPFTIEIPTPRNPLPVTARGFLEVVYTRKKMLGLVNEKTMFRLQVNEGTYPA